MLKLILGGVVAGLVAAGSLWVFAPSSHEGTRWLATGCPGEGPRVLQADRLSDFPKGCREFALVSAREASKMTPYWADGTTQRLLRD